MVSEPFKDVVTAHTTNFNIHQLCTGPIRCVCVSRDFHNKQKLFYYKQLASFYKELTLDPLTYVDEPVARVPLKNEKIFLPPRGTEPFYVRCRYAWLSK